MAPCCRSRRPANPAMKSAAAFALAVLLGAAGGARERADARHARPVRPGERDILEACFP